MEKTNPDFWMRHVESNRKRKLVIAFSN